MLRYVVEYRLRRQLTKLVIDAEARKRGDRTGLDTLVVHALNDEYSMYQTLVWCVQAKALSIPPGKYGRKVKTQMN